MEMSRDLASFEKELAGSGDYRDAFKVALDGRARVKILLLALSRAQY